MQCHEVRVSGIPFLDAKGESQSTKNEKEAIHSGHFMVSHFEAEAQDDEYEVAVPVPEIRDIDINVPSNSELQVFKVNKPCHATPPGQLAIETSLTKLFQCMSLAYRQKLTSPKWNRFKGIRLRWKDKIRLNNVIWRCWHMQFIKKENTLICQFASPLDEGTHNKPEAVVLEGKYWKRKLAAVTAEYKKWRMFYRNKIMGWACKDVTVSDVDLFEWQTPTTDSSQVGSMMVDEDYMELMSDTLFSTITSNQPFAFPDTREIARGANLADFIQPSLVQLQPNLDDFMDTLEPLHEFFSPKLSPLPEESAVSDVYRSGQTFSLLHVQNQTPIVPPTNEPESLNYTKLSHTAPPYQPVISYNESVQSGSINSDLTKTERFYDSKLKSQLNFTSNIRTSETDPTFINIESNITNKSTILPAVVNESFGFVTDNTQNTAKRADLTSAETSIHEQTFKLPVSSTKLQQPYKMHEYHKMPTGFSATNFNPFHINYDMSRTSETIPEAVASGEQHPSPLQPLQPRHRSRHIAPTGTIKSKIVSSPLSSTVDTGLNIPSALLAQLLTNKPRSHNAQKKTDRFCQVHSTTKTSNIPILPMPVKTVQHNKILPKVNHSAVIISSPSVSSQNLISTVISASSPTSSKENSQIQNVPSPGMLSQSPTSPSTFSGSTSPSKIYKYDGMKSSSGANEHRRVCHINAEQKRRYNIKNGFDVLHSLIPHLQQNPNVKLSKAAMLQKGAEYIRQLQAERLQAKEEMEGLKYQIESLSTSISNCQSLLPATGAPVSRHRTTKMKEMFDDFVRVRTMENWKFWLFSILFEPLLQSFNCSVSTASYDDLYRSTLIWVEQHCSLVDLRPAVLNSLRNLCTSTDILSDPSKLPDEARAAVSKKMTLNDVSNKYSIS